MQSVQAYVPQDGGGDIPQDQRSPVAKEDDAERRHCLRPLGSSSDLVHGRRLIFDEAVFRRNPTAISS